MVLFLMGVSLMDRISTFWTEQRREATNSTFRPLFGSRPPIYIRSDFIFLCEWWLASCFCVLGEKGFVGMIDVSNVV